MILRPSRDVFEACGRGLAERTRKGVGGTQAAVEYAELVTQGFPLEVPMLVEAVEAHRLLDAAVVRNGMETTELRISRLLWGGGPEWAEDQIEQARSRPQRPKADGEFKLEPVPDAVAAIEYDPSVGNEITVPMAAELTQPAALDRLNNALDQLDTDLRAKLEAAMAQAWATIRRQATAQADRALKRIPSAMAATIDMNHRDALLERVRADRYQGWQAAQPMLAMLSVELSDSISDAVADLRLVIEEIMVEHYDRLNQTVADELETELDEIEAEVADDQSNSAESVIAFVAAAFIAWASARLRNVEIDEGEQPGEPLLPASIAHSAAVVAGGATIAAVSTTTQSGTTPFSSGTSSIPQGSEGRSIFNSTIEWLRRIIEGPPDTTEVLPPDTGPPGAPTVAIAYRQTWVYGDIRERIKPFEPHLRLDGRQWITDDEGDDELEGQSPQDHFGCRCRVRTELILVDE